MNAKSEGIFFLYILILCVVCILLFLFSYFKRVGDGNVDYGVFIDIG